MPKEQDEFENFPEDIEHPAKSLWEQLLKTFKDFLNLHPQNGDQSQSEEEKRRKEEEEEEEKQRRRLVGQLSSILLEFTDLHKTSSIPEPEWQMPGYMRKSHWGPDSEIRAFAEHFSNNSLVGSLDNLIDGKDLTTKENAYKELKQGIESFKAEKQENVPERDKSNSNFGLDQNTADQIRKMEKYLDDYIKGCRPDGNKNTAEFKEAEAKLKQTRKTMDNPYYSPDYQQPKSEYAEFDSFFNNFNNFGSTTNREKPYPKPSYNNDRQKTGYTSEQQNKEDKSKAEEDSIKNGGQFIKDNNLTDMLAKNNTPDLISWTGIS